MDMRVSTLSRVEETIRSSYRQLFAIDEPELIMPQRQVTLFANQARQKHLLVVVTIKNQPTSIIGRFVHMLNTDTLLLRDQSNKVDHIIRLNQCTFIRRVEK